MVLSRSVAMKNAAGEEEGDYEEEERDEEEHLGRWGQGATYDAVRERVRAHVFAEHDRREGKWSPGVISQWLIDTYPAEMASMSLVGEDTGTVTRRRRFCTKLFSSHAAMGRTIMTHEAYMESILAPCLSAMKAFGRHNDKTAPEIREFILGNHRRVLREAGILTAGLSPREEARKIDGFIRHRFDHEGYPRLKTSTLPETRSPQVQAARKPLTDLLYALYNGEVDGVEALTSEPQLRAYLLAHHRDQLEAAQLLPVLNDEDEGGTAASAPSEDATALVSFIHKKFSLKKAPGKLTNAHYDATAEDREMVNRIILQICEGGKRSHPEIVSALMRDHQVILRRLPRLWKDGQLDRARVVGIIRQFFKSEETKKTGVSPKTVRVLYTEEDRRRLASFIEANEGEEYHRIAQRWNRRYPQERTHSAQSIGHFKRTYMRPTKPGSKK